jgi:hypothetical protein
MSQPQILEIAGGYQFAWNTTENVKIKVTRLHSTSDGGLKGELLITTSAEGYAPHIHLGQFNFSASRSRKELAKQLETVYPIDWEALLEQLVVRTIEMVRKGEPIEDILADNESLEPPRYLVEPFIVENYPNVIFGDPGSFKSTISLVLMALVTLPWRDNPLHLTTPDKSVPLLFLDWETDKSTISWQLSCLQRGMDTGIIPIKYRRCSVPLYNDLEQIQNAIVENKIEFIVIDSLGLACGGELNEAGTAIQFFTALRQLKVTSLILAHTSKDKLSQNKSIYGSVYFEAQARNIWHARKRQEPGESDLDLILRNTKSPPFRKKYQDMSYHVSFDDTSMKVKTQDPRTVAEFLETMGTQPRIIDLLKSGPQKPADIARALDLTENNVRVVLSNLKKSNEVVKIGDGYGLAIKGEY